MIEEAAGEMKRKLLSKSSFPQSHTDPHIYLNAADAALWDRAAAAAGAGSAAAAKTGVINLIGGASRNTGNKTRRSKPAAEGQSQ